MEIKKFTNEQYSALIAQLSASGPITGESYQNLNFAQRWSIGLYLMENNLPVPAGIVDARMRETLTEKGYQSGYVNRAGLTAWATSEGRGYFRAQDVLTGESGQIPVCNQEAVSEPKKRVKRKLSPTSELAKTVGQLLAHQRNLKGMTQPDLAKLIGKSARDVCIVELGTTNATLATLETMFAGLGKRLIVKVENL